MIFDKLFVSFICLQRNLVLDRLRLYGNSPFPPEVVNDESDELRFELKEM